MAIDLKKGKQGLDLSKPSPSKEALDLSKPKTSKAAPQGQFDLKKSEKPPTQGKAGSQPPQKSKAWLWIILILAILVILFAFYKCKKPAVSTPVPIDTTQVIPSDSIDSGLTPENAPGNQQETSAKKGESTTSNELDKPQPITERKTTAQSTETQREKETQKTQLAEAFKKYIPNSSPIEPNQVKETIRFNFASSEIIPEEGAKINQLIAKINQQKPASIRIDGFACNIGDAETNFMLSAQRALAVKNYLQAHGLDKSIKFNISGFGSDYPVGDNNTAEGRSQNRRAVLSLSQ